MLFGDAHTKNRVGYAFENDASPVPSGMAAVTATILFFFPQDHSVSPKIRV